MGNIQDNEHNCSLTKFSQNCIEFTFVIPKFACTMFNSVCMLDLVIIVIMYVKLYKVVRARL